MLLLLIIATMAAMVPTGHALPIAAMAPSEGSNNNNNYYNNGGNAGGNSDKVYFAALLRGVDGRSSLVPLSGTPLFRLLAASSPLTEQQQKKRRDLSAMDRQLLAKKYDRNCFFSPVQCTLQQWNDGNSAADEVLLGGGMRKRR